MRLNCNIHHCTVKSRVREERSSYVMIVLTTSSVWLCDEIWLGFIVKLEGMIETEQI